MTATQTFWSRQAAARAAQRRINRSRREAIAVGEIVYTPEGQPVRVEQVSEVPGCFYATPVKYNDNGIVRAGQSYWTEI